MSKYYLLFALFISLTACSGNKPYDEHADAKVVIEQAANEAKLQNKPVVIIFGANWCPDCRAFNEDIMHGSDALKIAEEFKIVKINVGNFDKNIDIANTYGNPIAGGIPGAAILSSSQKLLYVAKPGELSTAMRSHDNGIYTWLKQHSTM